MIKPEDVWSPDSNAEYVATEDGYEQIIVTSRTYSWGTGPIRTEVLNVYYSTIDKLTGKE